MRVGRLYRGPRGEAVGKDGHAAAERDDAPTLVIRGHEEPSSQCGLEAVDETREALRRLEVPAIEDEPARLALPEEADVLVRQIRPRQAAHEPQSHPRLQG